MPFVRQFHPVCRHAAMRTIPPKYPRITYGEYQVWWLNNNHRANLERAV
jgi:hypothetical protein